MPDQGRRPGSVARAAALTIAQVYALADATDQRYRALVLLAMFTSLRWSELGPLRRSDIDPAGRTVSVTRQLAEVRGGGFDFGPPKSRAGKRMVSIPEVILPVIQWHLACFAQEGDEGLVLTSPAGQPVHHSNSRLHGGQQPQKEAASPPFISQARRADYRDGAERSSGDLTRARGFRAPRGSCRSTGPGGQGGGDE